MKSDKEKQDEENKLKFENELKKLKIQAQFDGKFFQDEENKTPPDIESQFLDNILAFEENFNSKDTKKIKEVLGFPKLPTGEHLNDSEIQTQLEEVFHLLDSKQIGLDVIHEVPDREVYRFITEELLEEEVQIIPGMTNCFIYEEFHPNHHEDLKRYTTEFIEMLLKKDFDYMHMPLASQMHYEGKLITDKEFVSLLIDKMEVFSTSGLKEIHFAKVSIDESIATVKANIVGENNPEKSDGTARKITATLQFVDEGYWMLQNVNIPDLGI